MKILKLFLLIILLFSFSISYALNAPNNIVLDKAKSDSLDISWDNVEGASAYSVSYGKESYGEKGSYEYDLAVIVSEPKSTIEDLSPNTKYYIAIKSYDEENNESEYSEEVSFTTLSNTNELIITDIILKDTRNIEVIFNLNLDKNSDVNLNIVNKLNDLDDIGIENFKIENNILKLFLKQDLKISNPYSITILTISGVNGETIKAGVDGIFDFYVDENIKKYSDGDIEKLNSAGQENDFGDMLDGLLGENNTTNNEVINNTTNNEVINNTNLENTAKKVLGGKVINNDNIVEKVATKKTDLPTTGPTEILLFLIFSFIVSGFFFYVRRKNSL